MNGEVSGRPFIDEEELQPETSWPPYRGRGGTTWPTRNGQRCNRCYPRARSQAVRRNGTNASSSTGSAGGCGSAARGGTCPTCTDPGRPSTDSFAAGSAPGSG